MNTSFDAHVAARTVVEWRPSMFANYEVSEYGDVRRTAAANGATVGKILKRKWHEFGYPRYDLRQDGKAHGIEAHRLVAAAFLGPRPAGTEVAHADGDPKNCHYTNLRYKTHCENESDKRRHGTIASGERNGGAKLTAEKVIEIRQRLDRGETLEAVGNAFGIAFQTVSKIKNRERWAHVA